MTKVIDCLPGTQRLVPGRIRELWALQAEQQHSTVGGLRLALVLGEAGLGKTRLAAEMLPRDDETTIGLVARNSALRHVPPLGPWAAALGLHAEGMGSQHLVEWMPGLLAKASADRPVVVVLDDAHHGHDAVWEMLLRLAWESPASRLFVLVTARPAELARHRTATEVLRVLDQDALIHRLTLAPFSRGDVGELAAEILQSPRVPATLVDWLMAHTQGNPRLAAGLLEGLAEKGADPHAPALDAVPDRVARWVRHEVSRLDPAALTLVELLAVADDLVALGDLTQVTGQPIEDVARALEQLVQCGMVLEQQQHGATFGYQLTHRLTREVLYTGIGGARRRLMHRRWAATLRGYGRTDAAAAHYVRAAQAGDGDSIDALIDIAVRAAHRGLGVQVWQTVVTLQDLLPADDRRWPGVFDALFGRHEWGIVDRTEHPVVEIAAVRRLRQLLAGVTNPQRQVDVRLWLAGLFVSGAGDLETGERECRQALALSRRVGHQHAVRTAAVELVKIRCCIGDLRGAELAARQQLTEAERVGDRRAVAETLTALAHTMGWQGQFDAAEQLLLRSVELGTAAGRLSWVGQSLALLASLDACRGHLASARTRWAQAAACGPHHDPMLGGCGAFIELVAGDLSMVAAHARQGQTARSDLPVRLAGRMAMAAAERGQLTEARRDLDAMTRGDSRTLGVLEPLYWWAHGVLARAEGRPAAAAAALQQTVDCYAAMNAWALRAFALADLAEIALAAGDGDAAASAAASAQATARRTGAPLHQALHLLATSWALSGHGQRDQAARTALRAVDEFSFLGYALLVARAQIAYAHAVQRSDRGAAKDVLREAIGAFDICGAAVRAAEARAALRRLESGPRCTTAVVRGCDSLTRRERQVAELAAAGYTAAQIATRLHIGVRTVETHLAHSYAKLGVTSKQQLVLRRAELGLAPGQ